MKKYFHGRTRTGDLVERFMRLGGKFTPHEVYSMGYFEQNVARAYADTRRFDKAIHAANRALEIVQPVPSARRVEGSVYRHFGDRSLANG